MEDFNLDKIMEKIQQKPPAELSEKEVLTTLELSKELLIKENNVLELSDPIVVVGDIHGQLYDLLEIFRIEPPPPESKYLFLGDYVDRGYYSLEVLIYLLCLKIKYPQRIFLLRGNHESVTVTRTYGFYSEINEKFNNITIYQKCCDVFNYFPLTATINGRIFCVHGGLSPSVHLIDQVNVIDRFQEPMLDGPLPDLLWGDPNDRQVGFQPSKRGVGFIFGEDVTRKFAHINRVAHICRAHQLAMHGYEMFFDGLLSTVWSAPNYMYRSGNLASVMKVTQDQGQFTMSYNIFDAVPSAERTIPERERAISSYFL
ncbi:protein phosphatase type 2A [Histomonas meleagridis]|uniref:protein phosphatase type 2A n=1 Tax=Histomonas meleagridis TaxID=135588 RepID=UPI00355A68D0|nr:protein phosphatase type 2A [Histomonas meleagridis]KAH0800772.1 protein phosphatase type 2A [Histomonas meleagridis]